MLEWHKVNDEQIKAEYIGEGLICEFTIDGPNPTGRYEGNYSITIYANEICRFCIGTGKIINRAKHAAENYLKLGLSGRRLSSIHMWELTVGWEKYKNSTPDFIPIVVNGNLANGDLLGYKNE